MPVSKLNKTEIEQILHNFSGKNIVIIGDVMVDSYWWGKVNRISPEAPVPIVKVDKRGYRLGGAANVALNIKMLGGNPLLIGINGNDREGDIFNDLITERNMIQDGIVRSDHRPTSLKTRIIANNQQQLIRLDTETDESLNENEMATIMARFDHFLLNADAVILQDYDKGVLSPQLIEYVINSSNNKGIPTIVDPKNRNFKNFKNATLFKPNLKELQEGLQLKFDKPLQISDLDKASAFVFEKMNVKNTFITLSEDGVYINDQNKSSIIPSHKRTIFDVSGAGDSVAAVSALMMACKAPVELMAEISNIAGGLVCEHVGVVPVQLDWLQNELTRLASLQ